MATEPTVPISEKDKKAVVKQVWYDFLKEHLQEVMQAMLDKATGLHFTDADCVNIYEDKPDPVAARLLLEYAIGKPVNQVELSGNDGTPLVIRWEK